MKSANKTKKLVLALLLLGTFALTPAAMAAGVGTDKADYRRDDVAVIHYSGFDDSSVITVRIDGPEEWGFDESTSDNPSEWVDYWRMTTNMAPSASTMTRNCAKERSR